MARKVSGLGLVGSSETERPFASRPWAVGLMEATMNSGEGWAAAVS